MSVARILEHPVLPVLERSEVTFYWEKQPLQAKQGEVLSSALIANGISVFGHHHKDGTAQGIYCANGQCSKCMVIANGVPVKACMTPVQANMLVESVEGLPVLPVAAPVPDLQPVAEVETAVLIIGGGPAGLSAARELGRLNIPVLVVDDKNEPGGKLVLQTHKFFGSVEDSSAGTRGNRIGQDLAEQARQCSSVTIWTNSTAIFVFKDRKVGVLKDGTYTLVKPQVILNAAGAREKYLRFPGNHLVGIYGAGAFQTLVNRDLVRSSRRIFIVGGGNVGLIAGYHALQAGIEVVGLVEAMPACGGYKVHADKLKRLGVPIYTSHTILCANGGERLETVTIAAVDKDFQPVAGTEKSFACDTVLIAVGLDSISEFAAEAEKAGLPVFAAGDAFEIAEASSAMFNGRIAGLQVARHLGAPVEDIPAGWYEKAEILKSHPGPVHEQAFPSVAEGVLPVLHCLQEIPCNPCTTVCPSGAIQIPEGGLMGLPVLAGPCTGCGKCLLICPGLAITLVDYRKDKANPVVTVPYEVFNYPVQKGDRVRAVDIDGNELGRFEVTGVTANKSSRTQLIRLQAPADVAPRIVSFRLQDETVTAPLPAAILPEERDRNAAKVCLCERVTVEEVRTLIRKGVTDINQIKAITRAGMGSCGSKTCETMIRQVFRQEGIPAAQIVANTKRPLFVEIPLGILAGATSEEAAQ